LFTKNQSSNGKNKKFQLETPQNYIEAYRLILMTCAGNFFDEVIKKINQPNNYSETLRFEYLSSVNKNFGEYMK
jgi:hypothetical protein